MSLFRFKKKKNLPPVNDKNLSNSHLNEYKSLINPVLAKYQKKYLIAGIVLIFYSLGVRIYKFQLSESEKQKTIEETDILIKQKKQELILRDSLMREKQFEDLRLEYQMLDSLDSYISDSLQLENEKAKQSLLDSCNCPNLGY